MKKNQILRICICAVNIALLIVLDRFSIPLGNMKISFSGLPIVICAALYGPIDGMIVGFIGAFVGQMLGYGFTPTTLLWCLPHLSRGLFVGLMGKIKKYDEHPIYFGIIVVISSLIVTIINTAVMAIDAVIYDYYSNAYVFGALLYRFIIGIGTAVVYTLICLILLKVVPKVKTK